MYVRVRPRFFDQVGHETMYASSGNKHFFTNLVIVRPTKIMNRADENWAQFYKIKYLKNQKFQKHFVVKVGLLVSIQPILKVRILRCSRRLFIILVSLTMT